MRIRVCAPSYKRADNVRTLSYLPYCSIYVAYEEYEEYKKNYPQSDIIQCPEGVQGNLCRVRNYILDNEFNMGADVVCIIDDDLRGVARYEMDGGYGYKEHRLNKDEFLIFIEKYSIMAEDVGAKLWGINCNHDRQSYRHCIPFSFISYICGPFQCFIKGNACKYDERLPLKEDYDMTLQQLNKERKVLRINAYHHICEQSTMPGGCATYRNMERERQQLLALKRKWGGQIVRIDNNNANKGRTTKMRVNIDYNPIIKPPIKGV